MSAAMPNSKEAPDEYINLSKISLYHSAEDLDADKGRVNEETRNLKMPEKQQSLYFQDGKRVIDFVLVWNGSHPPSDSDVAKERRKIFEANLEEEGLELEQEVCTEGVKLTFIKIHATAEVLRRYTEILKLRMPMKEVPGFNKVGAREFDIVKEVKSLFHRALQYIHVDYTVFQPLDHKLTAIYSRDKEYLFDVGSPDFFTQSVRSNIVNFILDRKRFSVNTSRDFDFGIQRLINDEVYAAAYPLHDGDTVHPGSKRYLLFHEWASVRKFLKYQPLDHIKEYFGVKTGLYFAWLGFYIQMLIPASIVGVLCFLYGCLTLYQNELSEDICNENLHIKMCPLCDRTCNYWNLEETCFHSRVTYLFDNPSTVFFAIFMSFWGTMFLELWKRYSAKLAHHWGLTGFDLQEEHPRPQYLARLAHVRTQKKNPITNNLEPYVPFWKVRVPKTVFSFSVVLLLICMAVGAVLGVILYRMSVLTALSFYNEAAITSYAVMFIPATAGFINLICIMLLSWVYNWLAEYLTEMELPRTQTEYDDSLTLKIYLFQFVNYYTSIFYIAFLKGQFVGYPAKYNRIFGYRQEECSPGGCLLELSMQLAIIMVGKQFMNGALEMLYPLILKWFKTMKFKVGLESQEDCLSGSQWLEDYKLLDWGPRGLFSEYLELILQYGFVTIFVAAFPLAPFFALLNNIFELRLDAKKFLTFYRRPVSHRVKNIGVWFRIMDFIGKLSVVTNAFIIAFTSKFIPRLVYIATVSEDQSLKGFLNHSLSYFNTSDFVEGTSPLNDAEDVTICRYNGYRQPPDAENKYKKTALYWHVLAARLAFIVVFQNVVAFVMMAVQWLIPDMPRELHDEIRREAYLTNEIIIKQEMLRARGEATGDTNAWQPVPRASEVLMVKPQTPEVRLRNRIDPDSEIV